MPESIIKVVNEMGAKEGDIEGIQFANMFGEVTINDIEVQGIEQGNLDDDNKNDEESTATNDDYFEDAKEVEEEDEKACNLEKEGDDDELQRDYFNSNVDEVSVVGEEGAEDDTGENDNVSGKADDGEANGDEEEEIKVKEELDDKKLAESEGEIEEELETEEEVVPPRMRHEVSSTLGNYWNESAGAVMEIEKRVHNIMNNDYIMIASPAIPQYGFAKGLKLFGKKGLQATYKELKNNLLDRDCVQMLHPDKVTAKVKEKALHYLMFLKRKRTNVNEQET